MLAKKPFKGGRLDDFISAGEAEAKYGPNRYAAVAASQSYAAMKQVLILLKKVGKIAVEKSAAAGRVGAAVSPARAIPAQRCRSANVP